MTFFAKNGSNHSLFCKNKTKYSRMGQVKFVEDRLWKVELIWSVKADHISSNFPTITFLNTLSQIDFCQVKLFKVSFLVLHQMLHDDTRTLTYSSELSFRKVEALLI